MLTDICRFEWRYHFGRASFAAAAALFFALGFAITASGFGPDNLPVGAPYLVTESLAFLSLLSAFASAAFVSDAVIRDPEHRMAEIVYSTPVGRFDFLAGRFAGAYLAALSAAALAAAGMALASVMPWIDPERAGAPHAGAYAWSLLAVTAPNVLFVTSLMFAVAALTRSALATYVAAVFVYVLYFVAAALTDSPMMAASSPGGGGGLAAALLDPFGLSAFFDETRYWTAAEKAARLAGFGGVFLLNRAVWLGAAVALWAAVYRSFSFRLLRRARRPARVELPEADAAPAGPAYRAVAAAPGPARAWAAAWASSARLEARALLLSVPVLLVLALWAAAAVSEIYGDVLEGEYGSASRPATSLVVGALAKPLGLVGTILLVYYGAEVFWRERRHRISAVLDATPAPASAALAAKWAALAALVAALVAVGVAAGVAVQVSKGYTRFEPALYLSLFYFAGLPLALLAAATALVHALSPGKYVGMVASLLFAIVAQRGEVVGLEHHLWRFASAPPLAHSEMSGFGHAAGPVHWYMLFWSAIAGLMLLLAARLWRAVGSGWRERLRLLRGPRRRPGLALAAALAAVAVGSGGWIVYNTRVLAGDMTAAERDDWRADYERTYGAIAALAQPGVEDVEVAVDLYPGERRYGSSGRLRLVNRSPGPIGSLFVSVPREAEVSELSAPGARIVARDLRFGTFRLDFVEPLAPGAATELRFALASEARGFSDTGQDDAVVENGSFLWGDRCVPTLGYRSGHELTDPRERRRRGLPAREEVSPEEAAGHGGDPDGGPGFVTFAATVSTAGDQTAVAPGRLERSWEDGGRRYFRYVSDAPSRDLLAFASARYAVARARAGDVDVEVYYHPGHGENVPRMLEAAAASLDLFSSAFGPYPHGRLAIAEVPGTWRFGAFAMPGTVWFTENRGFLTDASDPDRVDLVTRRVAHEVAHQWWGHQLTPVPGPGASALVESLTKYSELLVLGRLRGPGQARALLELELDRYLAGRAREERSEPPLYAVGNEAYVFYSKGAVVLSAVRDLIGEGAMNGALRGLLREHSGAGAPPTSLDLVAALTEAAPERDRALIEAWMKEIVVYDLKVESAEAAARPDGRYDVTVRVAASRARADGGGAETPLPLDESVDVAVFGEPGADGAEPVLYLAKHALHDGANQVTVTVEGPPRRAAVDPNVTRIDRGRFDNTRAVARR